MVEAVLAGDGLPRVAALAAEGAGGPVAIVGARDDLCAVSPDYEGDSSALRRYAGARANGRPATVPEGVVDEAAIATGEEILGAVLLLASPTGAPPATDAHEVLTIAAVAALTEIAVADARVKTEDNLRGSLLEELRRTPEADGADVIARAARLGCDLAAGAVGLCAELDVPRPRHAMAVIADACPGALVQHLESAGRIFALLPGADDARALATRLEPMGRVGISGHYSDPGLLGRALHEAELVVDALRHVPGASAQEMTSGTYRMLFRTLASHPQDVQAMYDETVGPVARHDAQYGGELLGTLSTYLERDCNMNATATALQAHRHTIAYRLERVQQLSGLDPQRSEDRERLGLGLKAHRVLTPRLPR